MDLLRVDTIGNPASSFITNAVNQMGLPKGVWCQKLFANFFGNLFLIGDGELVLIDHFKELDPVLIAQLLATIVLKEPSPQRLLFYHIAVLLV